MLANYLAGMSLVFSLLALAFKAGWWERKKEDKSEKLLKDLDGVAASGRAHNQICNRQYKRISQAIGVTAATREKKDEVMKILLGCDE